MEERCRQPISLAPYSLLERLWPARRRVSPGREVERDCIHCGGRFSGDNACPVCGLDNHSALAGELTDLAATERQLRRFLRATQIDDPTYERLQEKIGNERRRLLLSLPPLDSLCPATATSAGAGQPASRRAFTARGVAINGSAAAMGMALAALTCAYLQPLGAFIFGLAMFVPPCMAALRRSRPAVHLVAVPFLMLGFSVAVLHDNTWEALVSQRNGWVLLVPFLLAEIAALFLRRKGLLDHAAIYAIVGLAVAGVSVGLVARPVRGLEDPAGAARLCGFIAAVGFVFNRRWRVQLVGSCCCALLLAGTLWILCTAAAASGRLGHRTTLEVIPGSFQRISTSGSLRESLACTAMRCFTSDGGGLRAPG